MDGLRDFVEALGQSLEPWRILASYLGKDGTPADWQKEMSREGSKDGAVVFALCSRRAGKSVMTSALAAAELILPKRRVIIVAPTLPQARLLRLTVEEMVRDHVPMQIGYDATQEELRMHNGSMLRVVAAGTEGASVRGEGIRDGMLILEECAYLPAAVWDAAIPLVESRGNLCCITTPTAKDENNRAFQIWTNKDNAFPGVHRIRVNAYDQPYLQEKLGRALKLMPPEMVEREYGTAWIAKEGVGLIHPDLLARADIDRKGWDFGPLT